MDNSKLINLLRTFSAKEMRLLSEFIRSPYHNKNVNIFSFFVILEKNHPVFQEEKIKKEKVFQLVFGKVKYDDVKMRGLLSDTLELVEEFLAIENMRKQGFSLDPFLLNELNIRNQDVLFDIRSRKMKEEKNVVQDKFYFLNRYMISDEVNDMKWKQHDNRKEKLIGDTSFEQELKQLTEYYAYEAMRQLNRMSILQYAMHDPNAYADLREKILLISESLDSPPKIFPYLKLFQKVAAKDDHKAFAELKSKLLNPIDPSLSRNDILMGLDFLSLYCFGQSAKGNKEVHKDTFEILKRYVDLGLHMENGFIEEAQFSNMVIVALKIGKAEWARKYVLENEKDLPKQNRKDVVAYCLGSIAEVEGNFKEALTQLNQVRKPGLLINMNIKAMLIKIYYAKGDMEQVLKTCKSFYKFLVGNTKLSEFQKKVWCAFVDNSMILAKINLGIVKMDVAKWIEEMEDKGEMIIKGWVIRNAREIFTKERKAK